MFIPGKIYNRRKDIHEIYGGQQQGGICTPANHPIVIIFTGDSGSEFGYKDGVTAEGIYQYTGEGQLKDMQFIKGNKAIRDHVINGKDLCLFEYVKKGNVKFIDYMVYTGYHFRKAPDREGNMRQVIVFELAPASVLENDESTNKESAGEKLNEKSLNELRKLAETSSGGTKTVVEKTREVRIRSNAVKEYALKRANGICECCGEPGPFEKDDGSLFLEVHHIKRLSDGGPDKPEWVAGICPDCHRESHYGKKRAEIKERLLKSIALKEKQLLIAMAQGKI